MATLRFPVGRQRLARNIRPSEQRYTRNVRAQMQAIVKNARQVINAIEMTSIPAIEYGLRPIYDESQILVPVKTGQLKGSGFIEVKRGARGVQGVVGYGKAGNPDYAVFVHERMDLHHESPTQAKFLEEAVKRHIGNVAPRYADFVRKNVGL